jgi:glycosyltransferase involved in cell wall biosynthesis
MVTASVVVPTYNRAVLLERCLASLRRGGIPGLEIVVVDDGGADNSADVARAYGAVYLRQSNAGPAAARNLGFQSSQGRYVAFIDDDDEWLEGEVGRLVDLIDANDDIGLLFADALMGNETDGFVSFIATYGGKGFAGLPYAGRSGGVRILERRPFFVQLSTRDVMFLGSTLIRRDYFESVGGFDRALRGAADWDFFMRATIHGGVAYADGPPVSRYYKHPGVMSADSDHMEADYIRALDSVRRRARLDAVERHHVDGRLRDHIFGWAWGPYDRGDLAIARQRLLIARELGVMGRREAAYLAVTHVPAGLLAMLRRARRLVTREA